MLDDTVCIMFSVCLSIGLSGGWCQVFNVFVISHSQVFKQRFSRKQTSPSSATLSVTLLITTTIRSPPACSVLVMRKEALMPARSECACVYAFWCVWVFNKWTAFSNMFSYETLFNLMLVFLHIFWMPVCAQCLYWVDWYVIAFLFTWIPVHACLKWVVIMCVWTAVIVCGFRETAAVLLW